jgi:MFS family permease
VVQATRVVVNNRGTAWLVLALTAAVMVGNFYVYDSIGPIADLLQRQRNFSDTQIGLLNAIYNFPNVLLILVGGIFVDRFGAARMTLCTAAVCFVGAALTAFSQSFVGMALGRLFFGVGAGGGNGATAIGNPLCTPSLTALGLSTVPTSYSSDSLWSYEIGAKDTLFNRRLAIEASAFMIDWSNIQTSVNLPSCAQMFTANRGKAISRGFDLQVWRPSSRTA